MVNKNSSNWHHARSGAAITVRLGPAARENQITDILDDGTLSIRLVKSTTETNQELIRFLAKVLNIKTNQLEVVAGQEGKDKLIAIDGLDPGTVDERVFQFRKK